MTAPSIMWFRQDLRLADNAALTAAAAAGPLICVYVLDDETPGDWRMGAASRWWLHHSLKSLSARVPLVLRKGAADRVIAQVLQETGAASVHFSRDCAPWSGALEARVKSACEAASAECRRYRGYLLHEPEAVRNGSGEPYKVYTPFARACFAAGEPRPPASAPKITNWDKSITSEALADWRLLPTHPDWAAQFKDHWQPGESGAVSRLQDFLDNSLLNYASGRDYPASTASSGLSAHLHFGEVSPAQCWSAVRMAAAASGGIDLAAEKFLKELLWREFSAHLLHHWPDLPEKPFKPQFENLPWSDDQSLLRAWQRGLTGYPIVDAGMRQLWATGIMHNRVRMIAASFLVKDLLIHWTQGQRWFWDTLVDADIASNAASWQWVAGCGADAAPYFRIFNPVLQGEKFDTDGVYVRRWLPELAGLPNAFIHRPWQAPQEILRQAGVELGQTYPAPIVDHSGARTRALAALKSLTPAAA